MIKKGLGRGLEALIQSADGEGNSGIAELKINEIEPNMKQPRKAFDDEKLKQLSESIKKHGVVQPIIVKRDNGIYRIVAGERRWRAARLAGLSAIPVIIRDLSDKQIMEVALIENLQREDLNPIEEAEAYDRLIKEYNLTQEDISVSVGKSRSAIANSVRLLVLPSEIKAYLASGELSSGHARTLIAVEDEKKQILLAQEIIKRNLNVRDTESLVKRLSKKKEKKSAVRNIEYMEIEDKLKDIFGTKVKLLDRNNKGKIMIEYYSSQELERILEMLDTVIKK